MNLKKNKIGILGGSFDPAHKGHLAISREALKKFKLKKIVWAITKKNPFKRKTTLNLSARIKHCKIRSSQSVKYSFLCNYFRVLLLNF